MAEDLANGIDDFLRNPDYYLALKEKCRRVTKEKYDWGQVVNRLEAIFLKAVSHRNNQNCRD